MESPYLTAAEVAQHLRVDTATVRRWCAEGDLEAVRAGRQLRVHRDALSRFTTGQVQDRPA